MTSKVGQTHSQLSPLTLRCFSHWIQHHAQAVFPVGVFSEFHVLRYNWVETEACLVAILLSCQWLPMSFAGATSKVSIKLCIVLLPELEHRRRQTRVWHEPELACHCRQSVNLKWIIVYIYWMQCTKHYIPHITHTLGPEQNGQHFAQICGVFSCMQTVVYLFKFHCWNLFLGVQITISQNWFR